MGDGCRSRQLKRRGTKRGGNDPAVSSIRVLGALPTHGLQAWLLGQMGWGRNTVCGTGAG